MIIACVSALCIYKLTCAVQCLFFYVIVHYNGYLEYADEPYDSTRLRNKQCQVKLGQSKFFHLHKHMWSNTSTVRWIRHFGILLMW